MTGSGQVQGVAPGTARFEARAGTVADTARVRVRLRNPQLGEVVGRIEGGSGATDLVLAGMVDVRDVLADEARDRTVVFAVNSTASPGQRRDTTLVVALPRLIGPGALAIGPYPLGGAQLESAAAYLAVGTPDVDQQVYYSVGGGVLEVMDARYPERPGLMPGTVDGRVSFRATRYVVGPGGAPVATGDTITLTAEFSLHLHHKLLPRAVLTLGGGGPLQGTSLHAIGQTSWDEGGGILVWWEADFDGLPHGYPYEGGQEFRLKSPRPGTFALGGLTPTVYLGNPAAWPDAYSTVAFRGDLDLRLWLSTGGTLTITRYIPPTLAYYGEIHGTVSAALEAWSNETTRSGDTLTATSEFAIQIWPLGGIPADTEVEG